MTEWTIWITREKNQQHFKSSFTLSQNQLKLHKQQHITALFFELLSPWKLYSIYHKICSLQPYLLFPSLLFWAGFLSQLGFHSTRPSMQSASLHQIACTIALSSLPVFVCVSIVGLTEIRIHPLSLKAELNSFPSYLH